MLRTSPYPDTELQEDDYTSEESLYLLSTILHPLIWVGKLNKNILTKSVESMEYILGGNIKVILSGSIAEQFNCTVRPLKKGCDFFDLSANFSDMDYMFEVRNYYDIEENNNSMFLSDHNDAEQTGFNIPTNSQASTKRTTLIMTPTSRQVYFKLCHKNGSETFSPTQFIYHCVEKYAKNTVLYKTHEWEIKGPASRIQVNNNLTGLRLEYDYVWVLKLKRWPEVAKNWSHKKRSNCWPNAELIEQVTAESCYLVPIGNRKDPEREDEWRLSFSLAEIKLALSITDIQRQAYLLLRIYIREFVKPCEGLPTYYLKTTFFWCLEELPPEKWRKENLMWLVIYMMDKLIDYYTHKFLPHYFVPEYNLIGDLQDGYCTQVTDRLGLVRTNPQNLLEKDFIYAELSFVRENELLKLLDKQDNSRISELQEINSIQQALAALQAISRDQFSLAKLYLSYHMDSEVLRQVPDVNLVDVVTKHCVSIVQKCNGELFEKNEGVILPVKLLPMLVNLSHQAFDSNPAFRQNVVKFIKCFAQLSAILNTPLIYLRKDISHALFWLTQKCKPSEVMHVIDTFITAFDDHYPGSYADMLFVKSLHCHREQQHFTATMAASVAVLIAEKHCGSAVASAARNLWLEILRDIFTHQPDFAEDLIYQDCWPFMEEIAAHDIFDCLEFIRLLFIYLKTNFGLNDKSTDILTSKILKLLKLMLTISRERIETSVCFAEAWNFLYIVGKHQAVLDMWQSIRVGLLSCKDTEYCFKTMYSGLFDDAIAHKINTDGEFRCITQAFMLYIVIRCALVIDDIRTIIVCFRLMHILYFNKDPGSQYLFECALQKIVSKVKCSHCEWPEIDKSIP